MNLRLFVFRLSLLTLILSSMLASSLVVQGSQQFNSSSLTRNEDKNLTINSTPLAFSCNNVTEIPETECNALVALYNSTNGTNWTNHTGWLSSNIPCSWYHVTCGNNHIIQLFLSNNQLKGNIPLELSNLTNLQYLILFANQLTGSIPPQLGNLANLTRLVLGVNQLSGSIPPQLSNLTNLTELNLISNQFTGNIPPQLGNLINLTTLGLDGNQFTGSIPAELGNLTNLTVFSLNFNQLTGSIPPQLGNPTNLTTFGVVGNQLSGSIPTEIGNLINLVDLHLSNNQFSGALPSSFINLTKLDTFEFNNTSLCEPTDAAFQAWLASIPNLMRTSMICTAPPTNTFTPTPSATSTATPVPPPNTPTNTPVPPTTPIPPSNTSISIAAGGAHTCTIVNGGGIKCWGDNYYGQLGNGLREEYRNTPVDVSGLTNGVTAIALGDAHSCALTNSGGAKCWGLNFYGQLGSNGRGDSYTPIDVSGLASGVTVIAAGASHTCAVMSNGAAKCWGSDSDGQVGDGASGIGRFRIIPTDVAGLNNGVTSIVAGYVHTCALLSTGAVKCWGQNYQGQLGDGSTTGQSTPVDVVGLNSGVTAIAAGGNHTCALLNTGAIKCWGAPNNTPVDVVGLNSGVTAIAAGGIHTCALLNTGVVKCWGSNNHGQLGNDSTTGSQTPVDVIGLNSVVAIAAGGYHACAGMSDGAVKCWGMDDRGQLGDGTTSESHIPVGVVGLDGGTTAYSISGRVIDSSGNCTGDVTITTNTGKGSITSTDSNYTISGLAAGTYMLTASKSGCDFSSSPPVTIPPNATQVNFLENHTSVANLSLEQSIDVTNKTPPYAPNHLTLGIMVKNQSNSVTIPNVAVRFYDGNPHSGGKEIDSVSVGDLGPGVTLPVSGSWSLSGNIENHQVFAQASSSSTVIDPDLGDNTSSRLISVYYVDFRHDRDAYSFYNSDLEKIPGRDIIGFFKDFDIPEIYYTPLLPIIGLATETNGWCYGMSNSSIVYFFHPNLKPDPNKSTFEYDYLEARAKIRTYQWYQVGSMARIFMGLEPSDPNEQYKLTLQNIQQGQPVIHAIMDYTGVLPNHAHAVVAYKIVDLGTEKRVFYYDNNKPLKSPIIQEETYGVFNDSGFSEPFYSKLAKIFYNKVYTLPYQLSNTDADRQLVFDLVRWILNYQFTNNILSVSSNGAVDLIAVDSTGRRVGYLAGQEYNEIPGAVTTAISGMQALLLPATSEYQFQLTGTTSNSSLDATGSSSGTSSFSLNIVDPVSNSASRVVQFQNVTVNQNEIVSVGFNHGMIDPHLTFPDGTRRSSDVNVVVNPNTLYLPIIMR